MSTSFEGAHGAEETRSLSSEVIVRSPGGEVYAFGPVRVDIARHVVSRGGQPIALPPRTFELLLILVRSGGRALSRHELVAELWPGTFVEEGNLTFQVSTLRRALGMGAEQWIETVPKVGYGFTPEVIRDQAAPATGGQPADQRHDLADHPASTTTTASQRSDDAGRPTGSVGRDRLLLPLAVAALAALAVAALVWHAYTFWARLHWHGRHGSRVAKSGQSGGSWTCRQSAIDTIDIVTGARTRLSTFDKPVLHGLAISPDERTLLVSLVKSQGADLMVVEPAR